MQNSNTRNKRPQNNNGKRRPSPKRRPQTSEGRRRAAKIRREKELRRKKKALLIAILVVICVVLVLVLVNAKNNNQGQGTATEEVTESETSTEAASDSEYASLGVNEMGQIPVMMYHGIENVSSDSTGHTGGNVDADGYNRTCEAFRADLEMYYEKGYRMIRLIDYVNGEINVEKGKSPIVITFDDGRENQCKVTGLDENGDIIIDPNCGVGILEDFKAAHPDMNVTATFFVNGSLFQQSEYNEQILKWLVNHGYDIGNHTYDHINLSTCTTDEVPYEVGADYEQLESIIPGQYVNIIALPFGSGAEEGSVTRPLIYSTDYNGKTYETVAAMMVGWTSEYSPFDLKYDKTLMKRCRAYDNNGQDFDISYMFDSFLPGYRYVSDGNPDTIVIPEAETANMGNTYDKTVITY